MAESTAEDWGGVPYRTNYCVINNVWNKNAANGFSYQEVFTETIGGKDAVAWRWNWPLPSSYVVTYPEVGYGDKPWGEASGRITEFPVRASGALITANFNASVRATGTWNLAFQLWVVSSLPSRKSSITHEIMIWPATQVLAGAGSVRDTVTIGGHEFNVCVKTNHGDSINAETWTYVAFVPTSNFFTGPVVISDFTDYLIDGKILDGSYYITSVDFGNEIVGGTGITEITDYNVTVGDKQTYWAYPDSSKNQEALTQL